MKRIATISRSGNVISTIEHNRWNNACDFGLPPHLEYEEEIVGVIGPLDRIDKYAEHFHLVATNGCSVWADEIRRAE